MDRSRIKAVQMEYLKGLWRIQYLMYRLELCRTNESVTLGHIDRIEDSWNTKKGYMKECI